MNEKVTEKQTSTAEWAWRGGITLLILVVGFFVRDVYNTQTAFNKAVEARVAALEQSTAVALASRFTPSDWMRAKENLDITTSSLDKRVARVEDATVSIKADVSAIRASLDRLDQKLDTIK